MTDEEKVLRDTIREYAQKHSAMVVNIWREKRKGTEFISGRQLKLRLVSTTRENIAAMCRELSEWFNFSYVISEIPVYSKRYKGFEQYATFKKSNKPVTAVHSVNRNCGE